MIITSPNYPSPNTPIQILGDDFATQYTPYYPQGRNCTSIQDRVTVLNTRPQLQSIYKTEKCYRLGYLDPLLAFIPSFAGPTLLITFIVACCLNLTTGMFFLIWLAPVGGMALLGTGIGLLFCIESYKKDVYINVDKEEFYSALEKSIEERFIDIQDAEFKKAWQTRKNFIALFGNDLTTLNRRIPTREIYASLSTLTLVLAEHNLTALSQELLQHARESRYAINRVITYISAHILLKGHEIESIFVEHIAAAKAHGTETALKETFTLYLQGTPFVGYIPADQGNRHDV